MISHTQLPNEEFVLLLLSSGIRYYHLYETIKEDYRTFHGEALWGQSQQQQSNFNPCICDYLSSLPTPFDANNDSQK